MSRKGFTLIEVLVSLSITLIIILNCSLLIKVVKYSSKSKYIDSSLQNAIATISNELITAKNIEYGETLNYLNEKDEAKSIILQNHRLVITPGHNILCHDIDEALFKNENGFIKITLNKNSNNYTFIIGSDYENKEE